MRHEYPMRMHPNREYTFSILFIHVVITYLSLSAFAQNPYPGEELLGMLGVSDNSCNAPSRNFWRMCIMQNAYRACQKRCYFCCLGDLSWQRFAVDYDYDDGDHKFQEILKYVRGFTKDVDCGMSVISFKLNSNWKI